MERINFKIKYYEAAINEDEASVFEKNVICNENVSDCSIFLDII